jgi:hypothetical protein
MPFDTLVINVGAVTCLLATAASVGLVAAVFLSQLLETLRKRKVRKLKAKLRRQKEALAARQDQCRTIDIRELINESR